MTDFRNTFYECYVSDFKSSVLLQGAALQSYWKCCDGRVYPLIAEVPRDAPVLEIGCGPGYLLAYLRSKGFSRAAGIDISAEQVAIAVERGADARVADVFDELSRHDASLSLILAFDVVEHFSKEENLRLFSAMRRALSARRDHRAANTQRGCPVRRADHLRRPHAHDDLQPQFPRATPAPDRVQKRDVPRDGTGRQEPRRLGAGDRVVGGPQRRQSRSRRRNRSRPGRVHAKPTLSGATRRVTA